MLLSARRKLDLHHHHPPPPSMPTPGPLLHGQILKAHRKHGDFNIVFEAITREGGK
jgi:hypothetical protein